MQVPFIAFYRKEYVEPELNINDLWRVYSWDEKVKLNEWKQWTIISIRRVWSVHSFLPSFWWKVIFLLVPVDAAEDPETSNYTAVWKNAAVSIRPDWSGATPRPQYTCSNRGWYQNVRSFTDGILKTLIQDQCSCTKVVWSCRVWSALKIVELEMLYHAVDIATNTVSVVAMWAQYRRSINDAVQFDKIVT